MWNDLDCDGLQDAGEPGIANVRICLEDGSGLLRETVTSSDGHYGFGGLCAGSYVVSFDAGSLPDGLSPLPCEVGDDSAMDSNCSPATVVLDDDGAIDDSVDFGFAGCCGSIGDLVWLDANCDGLQDEGEAGIPDISVRLNDGQGGSWTRVTDEDGYYRFTGLCAGTYVVTIDPGSVPAGLHASPCEVGGDTAVDSDCLPVTVVLDGNDAQDETVDFGFASECCGDLSIGDYVWHDCNDGLQDEPDAGLAGVSVFLEDEQGTVLEEQTDANGRYEFMGLCPGTYLVWAVTPPGFEPAPCDVGDGFEVDSNCSPATVVLVDADDMSVDFGFVSGCCGAGKIGNFVWHDVNCNGLQDEGEPGIGGVRIILEDGSGGIRDAVTSSTGYYELDRLCAGPYTLSSDPESLPDGFTPSPCGVGADPGADSNCSPSTVILPADDSVDTSVDFGFVSGCCEGQGRIGDFVWLDENGNGVQDDGGNGLQGVAVHLADTTGQVLRETETDANGHYEFMGLCPSTYTVWAVTPDGLDPTVCGVGSNPDLDSNCSPAEVVLEGNDDVDLSIDFGFAQSTGGGEGCTPGYWKQPQHFDSWPAPYTPGTLFSDVFEDAFPGLTLLQVLHLGERALNALGRHTVAALLNAASPEVDYGLPAVQVILLFDDLYPASNAEYEALKDFFEGLNEQGCPLH